MIRRTNRERKTGDQKDRQGRWRQRDREKEIFIVAATLTYESVLNKKQLSPGVVFVGQEDKRTNCPLKSVIGEKSIGKQ